MRTIMTICLMGLLSELNEMMYYFVFKRVPSLCKVQFVLDILFF